MTTMDIERMPGGMKGSEGKGKQPENPLLRPSGSGEYDPFFGPPDYGGGQGGGGGGGPGPTTGMVAPLPSTKKKHIQKLEDFTNPRIWDKFKRQEFLYVQEYEDNFQLYLS
jgi:hypothetical protein